MKMSFKKFLCSIGVLGFGLSTQNIFAGNDLYDADCYIRTGVITLDYDGETFKESNSLPLKEVIRRRCHGINVRNLAKLNRLTLVAKSKRDYGSASLDVGTYRGHNYRLSEDEYSTLSFPAPVEQFRNDAWRLNLVGKIKVERVIIHTQVAHIPTPLPPVVRPVLQ